jgi:hypothetical protein
LKDVNHLACATCPNRPRSAKGGADLDARPRIEHRVERVIPEDRERLPARETNEGELEAEPSEARAPRRRRRLIIAAVVGALLLVGAVGLGWYWYTIWRWLESTDDAYTQADNIAVVPKVSGYMMAAVISEK